MGQQGGISCIQEKETCFMKSIKNIKNEIPERLDAGIYTIHVLQYTILLATSNASIAILLIFYFLIFIVSILVYIYWFSFPA